MKLYHGTKDLSMNKIEAMSNIYNSAVFATLSDFSNNMYRRPFQEIYETLKLELGKG